jgi:DNA-binding YbaB/EbfC family protein
MQNFGGGLDIGKLMKQAQNLQKKVEKVQDELKDKEVEASAGGGMIVIKIEPEVLASNDAEMLQDLIVAAVQDGISKSRILMKEEMAKVTGNLNLPGFPL